ncbi:MAG: exosortase/archaeosortase family protein [Candidatus Aenigmatarchaeota archaeon]
MKKINEKLLKVLLFFIKLNILVIPLYVIIYLDVSFPMLQNFLASSLHFILSKFDPSVSFKDYYLYVPFKTEKGLQVETFIISFDCTGWKTMYLLFALVLATPSELKKKFKVLVIGSPFLFFLNFIRILTTILFCMSFGLQYLEVIHNFLWREGLILVVAAIWYIWLKKENIIR